MPAIRTLKTFLAIVENGTFAATGKKIGLTAAAIGLQMRTLEEELNQTLFDRSARAVVLNPAGRRIVPQIEELVSRYEALVSSGDTDELSGIVVMGALVSTLMGAFADALWSLKQAHPRLEVRLIGGQSSDFVHRVEIGELDAAVVTQSPQRLPTSLTWSPLYVEPMVLIVPRQPHFELATTALDILRESPFLRFDRATWTGYLVNEVLSECKLSVQDEIELNSVEAIIEIVRQGFGVSIVPRLANVNWKQDQRLRVITLPCREILRHVGLIERAHHERQRFTDSIKHYFKTGKRTVRLR